MQLHVSPQVNQVMEKAVGFAVQQEQYYVGVEHLFAALLDDSDALPKGIQERHLNALFAVMREVSRTPWRGVIPTTTGEVFHTPRCIAAVNRAGKLAERFGRGGATAGHLLLAILSDAMSAPSRAMDDLKQGRKQCVERLQAELGAQAAEDAECRAESAARPTSSRDPAHREYGGPSGAGTPARPERDAGADSEGISEMGLLDESPAGALAQAQALMLASLTRDLTEAARAGKLTAAIGRDAEIFEILQILSRKMKNNAMLVGDAGVGKTQVVEGMALRIAEGGDSGLLPGYRILELNLAALMTGTQYRGAFEEKMLGLIDKLKQSENTVLFIDEAHLIMGAGATDGDSMDMANLLKPVLARGEIRCIGATTIQEYRKFVEKDPAIERRFQMVRIEELSEEDALKVLDYLRPSLERHHGVKISGRAMRATLALTQRYMPNRNLPDKAIDVLDQACARYRLKVVAARSNPDLLDSTLVPTAENKVTPHDIRKVVSQITAIPIEEMTAEERLHLNDLDRQIKRQLIGQDEAVSRVVSAVKKSRAGLADPDRPDAVMLFLGPTGVGKTQLAKLLANQLFGSRNHLVTFDMSEYVEEHSVSRLLGAPPGYVGHEEEGRLTEAARNTPFSILLFDEIEKAHPKIYDIFLPIFDEGRLKDSRGRDVSFKNCIIILTSNIGADLLVRAEAGDDGNTLVEALRQHFRPELINRIDEIVPFYPLLAEDIRSILRLEINLVRERLKPKKVGLRMYQQAYEYLAEKGYSPDYGAREIRRVVDRMVTTPISEMILDGAFEKGDMIDVLMENGELVFRKGKPHHHSGRA